MSVLGVILTFDDPAAVTECIRHLLAQTRCLDEILVVDNAGERAARASLESSELDLQTVVVRRLPANLGPAGGFAWGLAWFQRSPHEVAWVMDDDCWPESGALEALLKRYQSEDRVSVVFPTELDSVDGAVLNNPSWSGVLLPREVVAQVGLPREDFFWWMEDTEYLRHRMRSHAVPVVRESSAVVHQSRLRRADDKPVWKVYYEARNSTYMRFHIQKRAALGRWSKRMVMRFGGIVLHERRRFAKMAAFTRGLHDGYLGRLGVRFPVPGAVRPDPDL